MVDQRRTLDHVRGHLARAAKPEAIEYIRPAPSLTSVGLPAGLGEASHLVLLFLSTSCTSCLSLARRVKESASEHLWIVLNAPSVSAGWEWIDDVGLRRDAVTVDSAQEVFRGFGVGITPAILVLRRGEVMLGQTVPSYDQLEPLLSTDNLPPELTEADEVPAL